MNRSERRAQWREQNRARLAASAGASNPSALATRAIALHIDELVLHGFPLKTRHAIGDATQTELTRLLQSSGLPQFVNSQGRSGAIDGGSFNVKPAAKPHVIGSMIANAVYGGHWR